MVRVGMEVRSCTYYILGTDRHHFWNISIRDPRHNSDHYLVLGCLHSAPGGNTPSNLGGVSGSPSDHQSPQRWRTEYSRPYGRPS